jgi:RNA polymerase subunit RPABC4/transcription elongation factor Spt4
MPQKGVARNGEAFCLECKSQVDRDAERCPSCDSLLDEEVKAFSCPRCRTVLPLGTSECPQCGMKFRAKAVRRVSETAGGFMDAFQRKRDRVDEQSDDAAPQTLTDGDVASEPAEPLSAEQLDKIRRLAENLDKLSESRSELLSRMEQRHSEEKERLSEMRRVDGTSPRMDLVESEVIALADEIVDITKLHSSMLVIADDISALVESFDVSEEAKERGLAAKAMRLTAGSSGVDDAQLKAREDQVTKREEMVDRKIRGYAAKRKELEEKEVEISAKLGLLEAEKASLEAMRDAGPGETQASNVATDRLREEEEMAVERISRLSSILDGSQGGDGGAALDETLESALVRVESSIKRLLLEKSDAEGKLKEIAEEENEMTRLLKTLDQLLGQLPEPAIQKFTQNDEYKLYERTLARYGI